jgi:hypothetical protein
MTMFKLEDGSVAQVVDDGDPNDPLLAQVEPKIVVGDEGATALATQQETPAAAEGDEGDEGDDKADEDGDKDADVLTAELDKYIEEQVQARLKPELVGRDRRISSQAEILQKQQESLKALQKEVRDAKLSGMPPEEKKRMEEVYAFEDRKSSLDEYETELQALALDIDRYKFSTQYADFGVEVEDLENFKTSAEMENFCTKAELEHWREEAKKPTASKATVLAAQPVAKREPPAGASAPSDVGGGGMNASSQKGPVEGTGPEAMAKALEASPWQTVRVG